jgi:hypothetical protein
MNKELDMQILDDMEVGDVFDVSFGEYRQVSITCTQVCGFKYYLVLGNGIEEKLFFEGNSEEDRRDCLSKLYLYILSLEEEGYNKSISNIEKYQEV